MPRAHMGIDVSRTSSNKELDLGFEFEDTDTVNPDRGIRVFRYIQASSAVSQGQVVERDNGSATAVGGPGGAGTTRASALGVAQADIAANDYGFVQVKGYGQVLANGSVTANSDIETAASGEVTDFGAGGEHRVIGIALATDTGASTLVAAWLNLV